MNPATRMVLLRLLPVAVLIGVAITAQQVFGVSRLTGAIIGLVTAIAVRLALSSKTQE